MNGEHTKPVESRTEDLVARLGDESYCTSSDVWALRREAAEEIEKLRRALAPFVNAHRQAMTFMARCGDNHNAMESRDLYMWWAPRHLSVSHFTGAVIAIGEQT